MRCCRGVLLSRFCFSGHPPWTRAVSQLQSSQAARCCSSCEDTTGHARALQRALHTGLLSQQVLHTSVAVSSCLLLLREKKTTYVPRRINCEQLQCTSPSAYQLCLLKAREKNYNSKLYCQQRNNNSFKRSQCFSSVLIALLTKYAVWLSLFQNPPQCTEPHFQCHKQKLYLHRTENWLQAQLQCCGTH